MLSIADEKKPRLGLFLREGPALWLRAWKSFGKLAARGPADGPKLMVIPGFVATDRTTLGLQRALAEAGYRVTGWGLGAILRSIGPGTGLLRFLIECTLWLAIAGLAASPLASARFRNRLSDAIPR